MGLSTTRVNGIREIQGQSAPTFAADVRDIRNDIVSAVWGTGATPPTTVDEQWVGRLWYDTARAIMLVYTGTADGWQPVMRQGIISTRWELNEGSAGAGQVGVRYGPVTVTRTTRIRVHFSFVWMASTNAAINVNPWVGANQTGSGLGTSHNNGRANVPYTVSSFYDWTLGAGTTNVGIAYLPHATGGGVSTLGAQLVVERLW